MHRFKLEQLTRLLALVYEDVYVVSGPLWIPHDLSTRTPLVTLVRTPISSSTSGARRSTSAPASTRSGEGGASNASAVQTGRDLWPERLFFRDSPTRDSPAFERKAQGHAPAAARDGDPRTESGWTSEDIGEGGDERGEEGRPLDAESDAHSSTDSRKPREKWKWRSTAFLGLSTRQRNRERSGEASRRTQASRTFACMRPYDGAPEFFPVPIEALTGSAFPDSSPSHSEFSFSSPSSGSSSVPASSPSPDGVDTFAWSFPACRQVLLEQHRDPPNPQTPSSSASARLGERATPLHMHYEVIGPRLVPVPTHLFKVILAVGPRRAKHGQRQGSGDAVGSRAPASAEEERVTLDLPPVTMGAFVIPNEKIDTTQDLRAFRVPLEFVEWISGLEFKGLVDYARERARATLPKEDASFGQPRRPASPLSSNEHETASVRAGRESGEPSNPDKVLEPGESGESFGETNSVSAFPATEGRRRRRERKATSRFLLSIDLCRTVEFAPTQRSRDSDEARIQRVSASAGQSLLHQKEDEQSRALGDNRKTHAKQQGQESVQRRRQSLPTGVSLCESHGLKLLRAASGFPPRHRSTSAQGTRRGVAEGGERGKREESKE
ncbi:UNVERIFIED_CONTAM: DNA/RNA non-specific endonuclease [Hammondia hammondi]|eukprot:XP_008886853.1 DNA/RNA non-specific endonuclease [Hammondia hammondi]